MLQLEEENLRLKKLGADLSLDKAMLQDVLDRWVYERGIRIDFSRPGTPTDSATVESFNGRLRQECLNENGFMFLEDARCKIEDWRIHYNQRRPHSTLGWITPSEFAEKSVGCQNMQPT